MPGRCRRVRISRCRLPGGADAGMLAEPWALLAPGETPAQALRLGDASVCGCTRRTGRWAEEDVDPRAVSSGTGCITTGIGPYHPPEQARNIRKYVFLVPVQNSLVTGPEPPDTTSCSSESTHQYRLLVRLTKVPVRFPKLFWTRTGDQFGRYSGPVLGGGTGDCPSCMVEMRIDMKVQPMGRAT